MRFDCTADADQGSALVAAVEALRAGRLVVLPTDTVYGIAADAFDARAVAALLAAKGRDRTMPPPVLIGATATLDALVAEVPGWLRRMVEQLWPGPLTVICHQQASLTWDLGQTHNTVAVRVPDHPVTLDLLRQSGPLAVSSANLSGQPAATTIDEAESMLGESVSVYLDAGASPGGVASTILDVTSATPRVLREGPITLDHLREFNNTIELAVGSA